MAEETEEAGGKRGWLSRLVSKLRSVPKEDELKKRAEELKRKEEDLRKRREVLEQEEVSLRETKEKHLREQEDELNRKELEIGQGKEEDLRRREEELRGKEENLRKRSEKLDQEEVSSRETKEKNLQEQEDELNRKELDVSQDKEEELRRREEDLEKKERELKKKEEKLRSEEARLRSKKEEGLKNKEEELKLREEELKKKEEEVRKKKGEEPKRFSDMKYLLPFGRYVGSTEVEPPADEVLVGREGQRAYLIDLLISTGRRGAYLVTGHRGAGKTSFVKYCISEYEASVFSRFLRGNVGRGIWDRMLVLFFWLTIISGALLATELIQFFVKPKALGSDDLLLWIILLPVGIILLYPCVYAKVVLETCIRATSKRADAVGEEAKFEGIEPDSGRTAGGKALFIAFALSIFVWFVPFFGMPAQGVSFLIPLVCILYATVQAISFKGLDGNRKSRWMWTVYVIATAIVLAVLWLSYSMFGLISRQLGCDPECIVTHTFVVNLGLGLLFIGCGLIFRGVDQKKRLGIVKAQDAATLKDAIAWGGRWYLIVGVIASLGGLSMLFIQSGNLHVAINSPTVGALLVLLLALWGLFGIVELKMRKALKKSDEDGIDTWFFQPRPVWILTAKAIVSIIVALQLAQPVISFFLHQFSAPVNVSWINSLCQGNSLCEASVSERNTFEGRTQEEIWLVSLMVLVVLFHVIEYEWIIRPYVRSREGRAFGTGGLAHWDEREPETAPELKRRALHSLAELTLPWAMYKTWLPVLPVAVNLGFDRLDHKRVIQTMLVGLRERYRRTFLAWNSGLANLGRFVGLLMLLLLTSLLGRLLPEPPKPDKPPNPYPYEPYKIQLYGGLFNSPMAPRLSKPREELNPNTPLYGGQKGSIPTGVRSEQEQDLATRVRLIEKYLAKTDLSISGGSEPGFAESLWRTIRDGHAVILVDGQPHVVAAGLKQTVDRHPILFDFMPHEYIGKNQVLLFVYIYHIILFLGLFFLGHLIVHRMPLLPYKQNLRRIDDLLDSLSAHTKVTSNLSLWGPARWIYSMVADEQVRETERDPVDPRTVEIAFLQILEDIQKGGFRFPGAARHHLTLPAPEITFLFDELDKLGTRVDQIDESNEAIDHQKREIRVVHSERERSLKLRALLSDLKNILTAAPARFVFVGGRDLHDEWLADQTSRLPLLTSIFNTEVYLPSLLTDQPDPVMNGEACCVPSLHVRIEEYVSKQYRRGLRLYKRSVRKRWLPSVGLPPETLAPERFALTNSKLLRPLVLDASTGDLVGKGEEDREFVWNDFILFLTHRSMGNPKKLRDLLYTFIRPAGREFADNAKRWHGTPYRHVIKLGDIEVFRIQLLVNIYRHLALAFEERMLKRDDKYAISIFFLTDFMFKFHRRAFSWSNLERVDDLVHIHRLPDLREVQEEIVDHFSERFLHRVSNGLYSFRFRSDIAREVEYLSRCSASEMAAFNFTLDESLFLKNEYLAAIEGGERNNPDLVTAMGELYEFDQYFERARHHYRVAIELLDKELKRAKKKNAATAVYDILHGDGDEHARIFLPWGVARLRLMLQIGMTFELERDLEQAEAEYRSARNLARALVRAYADLQSREEFLEERRARAKQGDRSLEGRLHSLKHMNIIFQPIFSEAWLAEKFFGSVDASITLIEQGLWEIRRTLPFVRNPKIHDEQAWDVTSGHANFSLTMSHLHNKAGDLYFYKGRQPVTIKSIIDSMTRLTESREINNSTVVSSESDGETAKKPTQPDRPTDGYLLRAHYHYALSLHDLRRYIYYRVNRSKKLLSIAVNKSPTLTEDALPDLLFRSAVGCVSDMAEATIARVSLFELFKVVVKYDDLGPEDCREDCKSWLGKSDSKIEAERLGKTAAEIKASKLGNWFGQWKEHNAYDDDRLDLLDFIEPNSAGERLFYSLYFCHVGAGFCETGGYPEDAGRELLQVCETVTRYLWWGAVVERLDSALGAPSGVPHSCWSKLEGTITKWKAVGERERFLVADIFSKNKVPRTFWRRLIDLGVEVLCEVDNLFRRSRYSKNSVARDAGKGKSYLVGEIIPMEALTLLCSLGLSTKAVFLEEKPDARLQDLAINWLGLDTKEGIDFENILTSSLWRHAYPMINRLKGMKVLIDNRVLKKRDSDNLESEREDFDQALALTLELIDLNTQFDAPLHFTPGHSGMTCALVWLWGAQKFSEPENWNSLDRIFRVAQRDLAKSEEMYSMRRSYYEAISGLYYLYDDFNDRQIHYNHAIQMAGAELNTLFRELVNEASSSWRRPD